MSGAATWRGHAEQMAAARGWQVTEQADGRLAFVSGGRAVPIVLTGNDADAPAAIARAAAVMADAPLASSVATPVAVPTALAPADPLAGLDAALKQRTARITTAIPIARAIIDGRKAMGLSEKFGTLADRVKAVPAALEARADKVLSRLAAMETTGNAAFTGLEAVVSDAEAGVSAAEAAMRQLTNGGPLSSSGGSQSGG